MLVMCLPSKSKSGKATSPVPPSVTQSVLKNESGDQNEVIKIDKTQSAEEMRLNEVLRALGKEPSTGMGTKIAREMHTKSEKKPPPRNSMLDDTMYDLVELRNSQRVKKSGAAKTQTMSVEQPAPPGGAAGAAAPKAIQAGKFSSEEEDSLNEDDFAEPTAENYMANITDIEYVTHDMIRTISHTKDLPLPVAMDTHEEDYFFTVDLPELEKQPHYSWQSLQANTFLSNVLCLPTEKEKEIGGSTKDKRSKVTFLPTQSMAAFQEKEEEGLVHTLKAMLTFTREK